MDHFLTRKRAKCGPHIYPTADLSLYIYIYIHTYMPESLLGVHFFLFRVLIGCPPSFSVFLFVLSVKAISPSCLTNISILK